MQDLIILVYLSTCFTCAQVELLKKGAARELQQRAYSSSLTE